jgi:hypothetical protein
MMLLAFGLLLGGGALAYCWVSRRGAERRPGSRVTKTPVGRFGGVEILYRADACEAARALAGQRFLAKEAPALPLAGCTAKCSCKFAKLADRRTDDRRFGQGGLGAALYNEQNRRAARERRQTGKAPKRR